MKTKIEVTKIFAKQFNFYLDKYHDKDLAYRKALQYIATNECNNAYLLS